MWRNYIPTASFCFYMPSRRTFFVTTGIFSTQILAGCTSSTADEQSTVAIENRKDESVTFEVTIHEVGGEELYSDILDIDGGESERVGEFDLTEGDYRILASLEEAGATKRWFTIEGSNNDTDEPPIQIVVGDDGEIYVFAPNIQENPPPQPIDPGANPDILVENQTGIDIEVSVKVRNASTSELVLSDTFTLTGGDIREFDVEASGSLEVQIETDEHADKSFNVDGDELTRPDYTLNIDMYSDEIRVIPTVAD